MLKTITIKHLKLNPRNDTVKKIVLKNTQIPLRLEFFRSPVSKTWPRHMKTTAHARCEASKPTSVRAARTSWKSRQSWSGPSLSTFNYSTPKPARCECGWSKTISYSTGATPVCRWDPPFPLDDDVYVSFGKGNGTNSWILGGQLSAKYYREDDGDRPCLCGKSPKNPLLIKFILYTFY